MLVGQLTTASTPHAQTFFSAPVLYWLATYRPEPRLRESHLDFFFRVAVSVDMTVEDPGAPPADNGEFWLFGYGYAVAPGFISV